MMNGMTPEQVEEHDRAFERAAAMARDEILVQGFQNVPKPTSVVRSKLDPALQLFARVIEMNPGNWAAMWFIGKIYQRYGNQSAALEWFARAHTLSPSQVDVSREASISAMALGRSEEAVSYAQSALRNRPDDIGLQTNLALAFVLADRLREAKDSIGKATGGGSTDQIANKVSQMIEHFITSRRRPPDTTAELEKYWSNQTE